MAGCSSQVSRSRPVWHGPKLADEEFPILNRTEMSMFASMLGRALVNDQMSDVLFLTIMRDDGTMAKLVSVTQQYGRT